MSGLWMFADVIAHLMGWVVLAVTVLFFAVVLLCAAWAWFLDRLAEAVRRVERRERTKKEAARP